jgi:hypothetical protein
MDIKSLEHPTLKVQYVQDMILFLICTPQYFVLLFGIKGLSIVYGSAFCRIN